MHVLVILVVLASLAATGQSATPRITNGQTATPAQFPYLASLVIHKSGEYYACGGSLITRQWILTAAHCVDGLLDVTVNLGSVNRNSPTHSVNVRSSNVVIHPDWNIANVHNDVALIRIPPVTFTNLIKIIRLPPSSANLASYANRTATIAGWGGTYNGSPLPDNAQFANVQIVSQRVCAKNLDLIDSMICASTTKSSICGGDSGGPLALQAAVPILVGVASFNVGGCSSGYPAGFSRVTSFLWWIEKVTGLAY